MQFRRHYLYEPTKNFYSSDYNIYFLLQFDNPEISWMWAEYINKDSWFNINSQTNFETENINTILQNNIDITRRKILNLMSFPIICYYGIKQKKNNWLSFHSL